MAIQAILFRNLKAIGFGLVFAMTLIGHAAAKEEITWGLINFAPENKSRTDLARELIQEKLSAYEHETVIATIPRITSEIKNGSPWCWVGALKNSERESFSTLSIPFIFTLPQQIMVRKDRLPEFTGKGQLSLETLLQDRTLLTSIARSRVYSPTIDALLLRYPPAQSTSSIPEAIQMLLANRLDYVLEDGGVAAVHAKVLGQPDSLVGLPFKEMSPYILGRVMCPKTEWGKKVIADINAVLRAERPTPRYRSIVEAFHSEDENRTLRHLYDDVFLKAE